MRCSSSAICATMVHRRQKQPSPESTSDQESPRSPSIKGTFNPSRDYRRRTSLSRLADVSPRRISPSKHSIRQETLRTPHRRRRWQGRRYAEEAASASDDGYQHSSHGDVRTNLMRRIQLESASDIDCASEPERKQYMRARSQKAHSINTRVRQSIPAVDQDSDSTHSSNKQQLKAFFVQQVDPLPTVSSKRISSKQQRKNVHRKIDQKVSKAMSKVQSTHESIAEHCGVTIPVSLLTELYMQFHEKSNEEQRQWVLDQLHQPGLLVPAPKSVPTNQLKFRFHIPASAEKPSSKREVELCRSCWCLAQGGISKTRMKRLVASFRSGASRATEDRHRRRRGLNHTFSTQAWIERFGARLGDALPQIDLIQLPCKSKTELHQVYVDCLRDDPWDKVLNKSRFFEVLDGMSQKYSAKLRKLFLQCSTCHHLDTNTQNTARKAIAAEFKRMKNEHRRHVANQKGKYYKHRSKAKSVYDSTTYLSMIIDGMDQAKTQLPRVARQPKSLDGAKQCKFHVSGVIIHGHMHGMYTWSDNFAKDPNLTCTLIIEALNDLRKFKGCKWVRPSILYIQLDNCSGENKNQVVLTFLSSLVHFDLFKKIKVSFLCVGHTHEDIDQLFSRLSVVWGPQDIWSLDQLVWLAKRVFYGQLTRKEQRDAALNEHKRGQDDGEEMQKILQSYPVTHRHLTVVANIKLWLEDVLREKFHGITNFRCIRIRKDPQSNVRMSLRKCMCSTTDLSCEHYPQNYWHPHDTFEDDDKFDGEIVIPAASETPLNAKFVPVVPPRPLPVTYSDIADYFARVPSVQLAKDSVSKPSQPHSGSALSNCTDQSSSSDDQALVTRKLCIREGQKWFQKFFAEQVEMFRTMCSHCRELQERCTVTRQERSTVQVTDAIEKSMQAYRRSLQHGDDVSHISGSDGAQFSTDVCSDDSSDDISVETRLKKARREVKLATDALSEHLRDPVFAKAHGRYDTGGFFGAHELSSSDEDSPGSDDASDRQPEQKLPDPSVLQRFPVYLVEDVEDLFRKGPKTGKRQAHQHGGCVVGHHVLCRDDEYVFVVGDVLRRTVGQELTQFDLHYRGNVGDRLLGSYNLGWYDAQGVLYYKEKPESKSHKPYVASLWIETIITWSSDWQFNKGNTLPKKVLNRVQLTKGVKWDGKDRNGPK